MRAPHRAVRAFALASSLALGAALAACDQGEQQDETVAGPPVHVVGTNFEGGRTVPANGSVQIAFDRVLHPASVNRQGAVVLDPAGRAIANPSVAFDPVTRVLSLSSPTELGTRWLTPGQPYVLFLTHPSDPQSIGGLRAVDGAPIDRRGPRQLVFYAGPEEASLEARGFEPTVDFCRDVLPVFAQRCSGGVCHAPATQDAPSPRFPDGRILPAESLVLTTPAGILQTAMRRVSQESNTGPRAGLGTPPARVFGVDMPIIDPGSPHTSWLIYKLMMAEPRDGEPSTDARQSCGDAPGPVPLTLAPALARTAALSSEERARFSSLMVGMPMPYPREPGANDRSRNLSHRELARVRAWIAQGAKVTECAACSP